MYYPASCETKGCAIEPTFKLVHKGNGLVYYSCKKHLQLNERYKNQYFINTFDGAQITPYGTDQWLWNQILLLEARIEELEARVSSAMPPTHGEPTLAQINKVRALLKAS